MGHDYSSHASPRQHYRPGTARHRGVSKVRKVRAHSSGAQNYSLSAISGFGFTDLRQVRSSGATLSSVPETGTTLSLLGATVLALALLRRKLVVRKFAA